MIRKEKNKWLKYKYLKNSKLLTKRVPETRMLSQHAFWEMLSKYKQIVLKPVGGSRGSGVFVVSANGNHTYSVHNENNRVTIAGSTKTYFYVVRNIGSDPYMVQRCIDRATVDRRPFDLRVIVQRRRNTRKWKVTGKLAKVAGPGYFVSNITRSSGTVLPVHTALRHSSIKHLSSRKIQSRVVRTAVSSAKKLRPYFKGHRIYGLDMALDQRGHAWIIEANLYPAMSHFRKLKDHSMLRRILSYKRG